MDQTAFNFDSIPPSDEAAVLALLREGRRAAVSSTEIEGQFNPGTLGELGDQTESRKGESCKD